MHFSFSFIYPCINFSLSWLLGRRDYRGGDFRDRFDRRRSPHRRHSPDRDSRGHRSLHDRRPNSQERGNYGLLILNSDLSLLLHLNWIPCPLVYRLLKLKFYLQNLAIHGLRVGRGMQFMQYMIKSFICKYAFTHVTHLCLLLKLSIIYLLLSIISLLSALFMWCNFLISVNYGSGAQITTNLYHWILC